MSWSLLRFWDRSVLLNRAFLWLLFIVNAAGTVYGYIWYWNQLVYTYENHPFWQLVFVPDSPTASLFFTLSLLFLLFPPSRPGRLLTALRAVLEGLAVCTSIKYGVWAVVMIFAGTAQGDPLEWQHWMLVASHLGMALEALLYVRFMSFGRLGALAALLWLLLNDTMDYTFGIFPSLSRVLLDDLDAIEAFTYSLSLFSFLVTLLALAFRRRQNGK
ncbi:DUF1405 domain-containing protein [Paenibacillus sp. GCM10012307]|uniref:DUF1405 domain-containing protein n=1 Tax=Paenibacillus roseus TaxID=2798579 RepID=A0A934J5A7_9BACL|nr:DUF1405 domain-containing protein [Paenibacillus roseus]MBJ6363554.1 DUF1405 domain-containing protein [Paenibacillus roseus]